MLNFTANRLGVRHIQIGLLFTGLAVAFSLRVNLSVGIVAMTAKNKNSQIEVNLQ